MGPAGQQIGHAPLTGAFSAAAALCLRHNAPGQKLLARLEKKPDTGKALRLLALQLGRAVSVRLKRQGAVALASCRQTSGSRAREPSASLDAEGMRLARVGSKPARLRL